MNPNAVKELPSALTQEASKTDKATYDFLFGIFKTLENSKCNHSFSVHGKDQTVNFKIIRHRGQIGVLSFRPVRNAQWTEQSVPLDIEFVQDIGKKVAEHRNELSHESGQGFATVLGGLMGRAKVHSATSGPRKLWNGTGAFATFKGTLLDEHGVGIGYLDFEYTFAPARR